MAGRGRDGETTPEESGETRERFRLWSLRNGRHRQRDCAERDRTREARGCHPHASSL